MKDRMHTYSDHMKRHLKLSELFSEVLFVVQSLIRLLSFLLRYLFSVPRLLTDTSIIVFDRYAGWLIRLPLLLAQAFI